MSSSTESTPKTGVTTAVAPAAGSEPAGDSPPKRRRELFRMLLSILKDPERAYTVSEEIMSAAGENVVAHIGARVDRVDFRMDAVVARMDALEKSLNARMDALDAKVDALNAKVDDLAESMNARIDALAETVKAQSRAFWGVLGLHTALLVVIITLLLRDSSR